MATVTLAEMESKLLTLDEALARLQQTEPLTTEVLDTDASVRFRVDPDWVHELSTASGTDVVPVAISVNGKEHRMTKEAALQAGANFGLTSSYAQKIPSTFFEGLLNYHYGDMGSQQFNVLAVDDVVSAFTRPTLRPFSNIQLVERISEGVRDIYGPDTPIFVDSKFNNTLLKTDVRFVIPGHERVISGSGMDDVPAGEDDTWLRGIHFSNSVVGKTQTTLETYMFRWWCLNGATTTLENVGTWSRRSNGQQDDVYEWARDSVNEVLGGMEHLFDQVQALTSLSVTGNTKDVLREIFAQYEVPVSQREAIMERLLGIPNITMYHIMQAITGVANQVDMEDRRRDRLMRIGGALPTTTFDTLKARVWREGHSADPEMLNPYEPLVLVS